MKNYPSVSILIVNYNGAHLLQDCLNSVTNLDYPKKLLEVIVVDNNSKDNSLDLLKKNFPTVKVIAANENLGFTGGNNLGYEHATGENIVLLNNDTRVEKNWLKALVAAAKPKNIGIVSSKLLFDTPFLELELNSDIVSKSSLDNSTDFSPVGIIIEDLVCKNTQLNNLVWYESGFYDKEHATISSHWCKDKATILIPFEDATKETYKITLHGYPTNNSIATPVILKVGKTVIFDEVIEQNQVKQLVFTLERARHTDDFIYLIQNAGNILLSTGHSKDRGSLIRQVGKDSLEFYERDQAQFQKQMPLLAACGAACLIKRTLIDEIGFLDGTYFMYYEDTDFSLRAWRVGWDIVFEPNAVVYHKHKASTSAQSLQFFLHMVEKNHFLFVATHYPLITVCLEFLHLLITTCITTAKYHILKFTDNPQRTSILEKKSKAKMDALLYILQNIPRLYKNRIFWNKRAKRTYKDMQRHLY